MIGVYRAFVKPIRIFFFFSYSLPAIYCQNVHLFPFYVPLAIRGCSHLMGLENSSVIGKLWELGQVTYSSLGRICGKRDGENT